MLDTLTELQERREETLPLELIRDHCKANDVPLLTDQQFILYRDAAFESAELYTGEIWDRVISYEQDISESLSIPHPTESPEHAYNRRHRTKTRIKLKRPAIDGVVTVMSAYASPKVYNVRKGARQIRIDVTHRALDVENCCNPCGGNALNYGATARYRTGTKCADDVPSLIKLGMLKYIAWAVENPGDVLNTVRDINASESSGTVGTNNGAVASGAVAEWRQYASRFNR